jgi:hypothetical protein
MKIISFIEDSGVVEKNMRHLGFCETRNHHPPVSDGLRSPEFIHDDD